MRADGARSLNVEGLKESIRGIIMWVLTIAGMVTLDKVLIISTLVLTWLQIVVYYLRLKRERASKE